jgi:hypothetical protein
MRKTDREIRAAGRKKLDRLRAEDERAFVRGASWAYGELTGALIVPASFEQAAIEAATPAGKRDSGKGEK